MKRRIAAVLAVGALVALGLFAAGRSAARITISRTDLVGTWSLESRYDKTADGTPRVEPDLGEDPAGLLFYDAKGHVAMQLMKRVRTAAAASAAPPRVSSYKRGRKSPAAHPARPAVSSGPARPGYEAFFGTYTTEPATHTVTDHFDGALAPADVGRSVERHYDIVGDLLTLTYSARSADGTTVTRSLVWRRQN